MKSKMRSRFSNSFFSMAVLGVLLLGVMPVVEVDAGPAMVSMRQQQRRTAERFRNAFPTRYKNQEPEILASKP